jgi:hypothetical protein
VGVLTETGSRYQKKSIKTNACGVFPSTYLFSLTCRFSEINYLPFTYHSQIVSILSRFVNKLAGFDGAFLVKVALHAIYFRSKLYRE